MQSKNYVNPFGYSFCPKCGAGLQIRELENTQRLQCESCEFIFYQNPVPAAGGILVKDDALLLVKRKFEPQAGYWSLPAGFVEYSETVKQTVVREIKEETNLDIRVGNLFNVYSAIHDPQYHVVLILYDVYLLGGELIAGDDALEAAFFPLDGNIPEMAFSSHEHAVARLRAQFSGQE